MRMIQTDHPRAFFLALLMAVSLIGCSANPETVAPTAEVPITGPRLALLRSLPQVSDLPSRYLPPLKILRYCLGDSDFSGVALFKLTRIYKAIKKIS